MRMTTALSLTPRCGIMGPNRPYSKAPGLHKGCLYVFAPTLSIVTTFVDCTYSHQLRRSTSPFWVLKLESIRDQYSLASLTSFAVPSLPAQGRLIAYGGGSGVGTDEMKKGGRRSLLRCG